ncbi:cytochrome b/b6 domain-containing protein [Streptomyces sp. NPDC054794]
MPSTAGSTTPTGTTGRPELRDRVSRFSIAERTVHQTTALLMLLCVTTAACLYFAPLTQLIGRRHLLATIHVWSGITLPLPSLLGLFSAAFRADLRRLNRFAPYDRQWLSDALRRRTAPEARPAGKFNAGQKLYAGSLAGAVLVMLFTGLLMWCVGLLPFISRTSAIFVHDLVAWAIAIALIAHLRKALADPEALLAMRSGHVSRTWAERHHKHWLP